MQIKATVPSSEANKKALGGKDLVETVNVNLPTTLEGYNKAYGADFILDLVKKAIVIQIQSFMRGKMVKKEEGTITGVGLKGAALQAAVDGYKPTLRKAGKSFFDKAREKAKSMSDEEKRQLIAELTGQGGSGGAAKSAAPVRRAAAPARRPAA